MQTLSPHSHVPRVQGAPNVAPEFYDMRHWDVLLQMAHGRKDVALRMMQDIRDNISAEQIPAWLAERPSNIDDFFDKIFLDSVMHDPETLTAHGLFEALGVKAHNALLTDISVEAELRAIDRARENLRLLHTYNFDDLSAEQQVSYNICAWKLRHMIAGERFLLHGYILNQMSGILSQIICLFTQLHPLKTVDDAEAYVARLGKIPHKLHQVVTLLEAQAIRHMFAPRFSIERAIGLIENTVPARAEDVIFYRHFAQRLDQIDMQHKEKLLAAAREVIERMVYPAYCALGTSLRQLLEQAPANHGVWALPDGDAYYAHMLRFHTTTDLSADEIHELGLQEVERIYREMRLILAAEGLDDPNKHVGAILQAVAQDQRFYYPDTEDGRTQCLDAYRAIVERSRKELAYLFNLQPRTGVTIERVPAHEENDQPGAYYLPPNMDGSRLGTFYANLRDMKEMPTHGMETLAIHEAEPGHHFQLALQQEMDLPPFRKLELSMYTAYVEGWALYAEKVAYEHDFYSSSFSKLGHLHDELLRAARLVVDTGIHHKRWTREQAIAYMETTIGDTHSAMVTEVERYFVWPGQACAYKIGQLKILELRQRAREKLGDKFSMRDFHDVVLRVAAVPLAVLEDVVDGYIRTKLNGVPVYPAVPAG